MPDHAEVTEATRRREDTSRRLVRSPRFEHLIGSCVEPIDTGTEDAGAGRIDDVRHGSKVSAKVSTMRAMRTGSTNGPK